MTLHTPKAPETTVQRMVTNAMHVQNIEVETGWTRDDIKACAMRMGYALDAASQRFRRAPQRKPAPVGIVLASQTSTGAGQAPVDADEPDGALPSVAAAPVLPETDTGAKPAHEEHGSAVLAPASAPVSARAEVRAAWLTFFQAFNELIHVIESAPTPPPSIPTKRPGNYPTGPRLTHGATQSQIRDWARTQGLDVNPRGTVRRDIADAYAAAHPTTEDQS